MKKTPNVASSPEIADSVEPYRPPRRPPRKRGADRGLPSLADRLKLASTYLAEQTQLWPDMVARGALATATEPIVAEMAADLHRRHTTRTLDDEARTGLDEVYGKQILLELWAAYLRYSCDNSNPRSLDDQLRQILRKAKEQKVFIPWTLVFADASISGADPSREGYNALKEIVQTCDCVDGIIIDEFSRAGRDTLEWFLLAAWARRHSKNVRGATDDFNLNSPLGQMMLHVFAMFSEFFLTQLREKVLRGMKGAANRQTSVGRPGLGYGLAPKLDASGRPVLGADGRPSREKRVHPPTMAFAEMARRMLLEEGASVSDVVREFNRQKVDGSDGWTDCSFRRALSNENYFGFDIFNRTHNEWDPETFRRTTVLNPRRLWQVQCVPRLRVWDRRTYLAMRRKLRVPNRVRGRGGKSVKRKRNPTTMLTDLLECECNAKLKLVRGGRNAAYGCYHGYYSGSHGCKLSTAKAATIIEEGLLDFVQEYVLTPEAAETLVERSNQWVEREARRPAVDTAPLESQLSALNSRRKRLIDLVASDVSAELEPVRREIIVIGKQVKRLEDDIRNARRQAAGPVPPLTLADVQNYLADLRGLLSGDVQGAARALRAILGCVKVTEIPYGANERYGGKKGGRWQLTFTPCLSPALALFKNGAAKSSAFRDTLSEAIAAEAQHLKPVTLVVDRRKPLHERLAPCVKPFIGQLNPATGKPYTRREVACQLGQSPDVIYLAWRFAKVGVARKVKAA